MYYNTSRLSNAKNNKDDPYICIYIYKVKRYKAAAEERRATFCPFVVTVEGITHQSMQAFLRRIAARLSAKWQNPLSTVSNWVRACPCAVRAHQSGGSADQGLQEEVEELGVRGWQGDCHSLPEMKI